LTNNSITESYLASIRKTVPDQYASLLRNFKYYLHPDVVFNYVENIAQVSSGLGDTALTTAWQPAYYGHKFVESPLISTYLNGTDTNTQGIFTMPNNIKIGIRRPFNIKMVDVPLEDKFTLHVTGRIGWAVLVEEMAVLIDNIKHV
jgi:hypothetical protein